MTLGKGLDVGFNAVNVESIGFSNLTDVGCGMTNVEHTLGFVETSRIEEFPQETALLADERNQCAHDDGSLDGDREGERIVLIVLAEEDEHSLVEHVHIVEGVLVGALSFVVENRGRDVVVLQTILQKAEREVNVFSVHEEFFIERADFAKGFSGDEHEGT